MGQMVADWLLVAILMGALLLLGAPWWAVFAFGLTYAYLIDLKEHQ